MIQDYVAGAQMVAVDCYKCGIAFGIPHNRHRVLREAGESFWCPNGHAQAYCDTEIQRLKRSLESAQFWSTSNRERAERAERRLVSQRAATTRIKRRVAAGVCPCCKRSFQNLARHMHGQHPKYAHEKEPVA